MRLHAAGVEWCACVELRTRGGWASRVHLAICTVEAVLLTIVWNGGVTHQSGGVVEKETALTKPGL